MTNARRFGILFFGVAYFVGQVGLAAESFELTKRNRIVVIGHSVAEQIRRSGYFEALIHTRLPELQLRLRHLGDVVEQQVSIPGTGSADAMAMLDKQLILHKADVIIACLDMPASFEKANGGLSFVKVLSNWIEHLRSTKYNGKTAARIILVSPIAQEDLGGNGDKGAKARKRNEKLTALVMYMAQVAKVMDVGFVDLFTPTAKLAPTGGQYRGPILTSDGVKLNDYGCWVTAHLLADKLAPLKRGDRLVVDVKAIMH